MMILISGTAREIPGDFDQVFFWGKGSYFRPPRGADFGSLKSYLQLLTLLFRQYIWRYECGGRTKERERLCT
jgi:hypothetical protein